MATIIRLDSDDPDHLAPPLGLAREQLCEFWRGAATTVAPKLDEARHQDGIGEAVVDFRVEFLDDADIWLMATALLQH